MFFSPLAVIRKNYALYFSFHCKNYYFVLNKLVYHMREIKLSSCYTNYLVSPTGIFSSEQPQS